MFDDIRETIDAYFLMVLDANKLTKQLTSTSNRPIVHKLYDGLYFFNNNYLYYRNQQNCDDSRFIFKIGNDDFKSSLNSTAGEEKIIMTPAQTCTYYSTASQIPEEELFQQNTLYDDLSLCVQYITRMYNDSTLPYNSFLAIDHYENSLQYLRDNISEARTTINKLIKS